MRELFIYRGSFFEGKISGPKRICHSHDFLCNLKVFLRQLYLCKVMRLSYIIFIYSPVTIAAFNWFYILSMVLSRMRHNEVFIHFFNHASQRHIAILNFGEMEVGLFIIRSHEVCLSFIIKDRWLSDVLRREDTSYLLYFRVLRRSHKWVSHRLILSNSERMLDCIVGIMNFSLLIVSLLFVRRKLHAIKFFSELKILSLSLMQFFNLSL